MFEITAAVVFDTLLPTEPPSFSISALSAALSISPSSTKVRFLRGKAGFPPLPDFWELENHDE